MNEAEFLSVLDRLVSELRVTKNDAVARGDWRAAFEATVTALLWRVNALAIRIQVVAAGFDPTAAPASLAAELRQRCDLALRRAGKERNSQEPAHKIEVIIDVIDAIDEVLHALAGGQFKAGDGALYLALAAGNLGRCDVMLGFAEEGFWEQIHGWRKRQGGRKIGWRAVWKDPAAPVIQKWIDDEPGVKRDPLAEKLGKYLSQNGINLSHDSIVKAIQSMKRDGSISFPRGKSKKGN